ncbi:MAG: flagellar biosynthesis protein FliQ [Deltaproteobacteria bacterium]|nr:flagellar biosynthesis protein FliQ [Deltaproteobacteria bacterium]
MGEDFVLGLGQEALKVTVFLAAPLLLVAMVVGIVVSLLQAVTQVNEATLTFIPKIVAIAVVLVIGGPWMIETITHYTTDLITRFPELVR